jgi:hypothetical protein
MAARWAKMTPEQREQFRRGMAAPCGGMHKGPKESGSTRASQP